MEKALIADAHRGKHILGKILGKLGEVVIDKVKEILVANRAISIEEVEREPEGLDGALTLEFFGDLGINAIHETEVADGDDCSNILLVEVVVKSTSVELLEKLAVLVMGDRPVGVQPRVLDGLQVMASNDDFLVIEQGG